MGGSLESPNMGWTSETPTTKQSPREWLVECMQFMAVGMKAELVLGAGSRERLSRIIWEVAASR
jgi:hypothetical protein